MPPELREPEVIFGVDFSELGVSEGDFAVIAEMVCENRQVVLGGAKLAAYIAGPDAGPACAACVIIKVRCIFKTEQPVSKRTSEPAGGTVSLLQRVHS